MAGKNKKEEGKLTIDDMATFCKKKGFIYPSSEIYGGITGFFDYGPLGSDLKNNLKQSWWKFYVQDREDVVGIDGSIITHPKVWKASGHVDCFEDIMVECTKCGEKVRADTLVEDVLNIAADGLKADALGKLIVDNDIGCPKCKGALGEPNAFNLMFCTNVGPKKDDKSVAYLRPETAQVMFADFKQIVETARLKLPFGIAQMGRAFRNEISPRNFLFRCREFEQMEIEYFIHPDKLQDCPYVKEVEDYELLVYSAEHQGKKKKAEKMKIKDCLKKDIIKTTWHAYWLALGHQWFVNLGAKPENFRIRQHLESEKSHYALDTWDLEYNFPFGWKELQGIANRTDFDLQQHIKHSKQDLSLFDEENKKKIVPYVVAEPSLGVDRSFLVFMFDAYNDDKKRGNIVLKLSPELAPVKVGVFPLVNKLEKDSRTVYEDLKTEFVTMFDRSGSVGRRYARADEQGIPYCVTIDFDFAKDKTVTIRDRDTTEQVRVKFDELKKTIKKLLKGSIKFAEAGEKIKS